MACSDRARSQASEEDPGGVPCNRNITTHVYGAYTCQQFTANSAKFGLHAPYPRNLCPRLGLEDPACGNGNAALGAYYWECVEPYSRRDTLLFEQGHIVGMPSLIRVVRDSDGEVMIGGSARIMIKGVFHL